MATPESKGFHKKPKKKIMQKVIREGSGIMVPEDFQMQIRAKAIGKSDAKSFQEAIKKKAGGRL